MARDLGGRRGAQFLAAAASLPFCIGGGALMQYVSFDYVAWVLTAYFIVRLLKSGEPRWWLAVGASIGFGALSKYTKVFFVAAIVLGVLATDARRYLKKQMAVDGRGSFDSHLPAEPLFGKLSTTSSRSTS
jgi:4-amino-4-deoxy-L-arabinose transferase-like glycosyltransferase